MADMDFIDRLKAELNDIQYQAVTEVEGPMMIVAGAGSGKTRVLTYRLAFILSQGLADPQELLSLTFTNKAAKEMKARIEKLIGSQATSIQMGTFHSIFARLLRRHAEKLGYTSNYTIYDTDDCESLIKQILKENNWDDKVIKPRNVIHFIDSAKNRLLTPTQAKQFVTDEFSEKACRIYAIYQDRCLKANAMDFNDLLVKTVELFQKFPDILHTYQHHFKYIMVDEYQDTNHAQYVLTKMLAAVNENICVVGDDAQSIYAFRGANIQNILNFKKDYPDLKIFKLEQNYRSTQVIVDAANSVIKHNQDQIPKNVFTENESGDHIYVMEADTEIDEAKKVCDKIRELKQRNSFLNKDFAVLYRTNAQSRAVEDALRRAGIKYKIFGGLSFYKRKEIRDIVAYLRISTNPKDEAAMRRIINYPTRGISDATVNAIMGFAAMQRISFWEALNRAQETGINPRAVNAVKLFIQTVYRFQKLAEENSTFNAVSAIAKESGILKDLHSENTAEGLARWENVQELINSAKEYSETTNPEADRLDAYLAEISLFTDMDDNAQETDFVTLMTIHSAKGLEFKSVFIVGLEDGLFPGFNSLETRQDLEEERRLFYVAITRAEKVLIISFAKSRLRFGQLQYNEPSRFLYEIESKFLHFSKSSKSVGSSPQPGLSLDKMRTENKSSPTAFPSETPFVASPPEQIAIGHTVLHQKFGKGVVSNIEGKADDRKAQVHFDLGGQRVLLLKYAKLQIMGG